MGLFPTIARWFVISASRSRDSDVHSLHSWCVVAGLLCVPPVLERFIWAGHRVCCSEALAQPGRGGSLQTQPPAEDLGFPHAKL